MVTFENLLKTFTDEVFTHLDQNDLINLTVAKLRELLKLENSAILLYDINNDEFNITATTGYDEFEGFSLTRGKEFWDWINGMGAYVNVHNISDGQLSSHPDLVGQIRKMRTELLIPINHCDNIIGVLCLGKKQADEQFAQNDIDILLQLTRTISIAILNAQLLEKLSQVQAQASQAEKMVVIGTLASGISHEVCNPLGIIRGQCELFLLNLKDGVYEGKNPSEILEIAKGIFNKVVSETERISTITRRLSVFAKPAKGIQEDNVSLENELKEAVELLEHDMSLEDIVIEKNIQLNLPYILADKKQLQEIFFNLIRNAAQAIKEDGIITINAVINNDKICVDIKDTGCGIKKDQLDQIFDPFFTTKESEKGTGLGLFIVKQIVEKNNGRISVESEEGKGTIFHIVFETSRCGEKN